MLLRKRTMIANTITLNVLGFFNYKKYISFIFSSCMSVEMHQLISHTVLTDKP